MRRLRSLLNTPVRPGPSFNPFAWGTLFFTFWLTLITIPSVGKSQTVIACVFFGLSCLLWLATFIPPMNMLIDTPIAQRTILPWVFLASVFTWVMGSLTVLGQVPKDFQIIVAAGTVLWLFAYMAIFIWSFRSTLGTWLGISVSAVLIILGIISFFSNLLTKPLLLTDSWPAIIYGVASLIITLLKSKIGRIFPLI